MDNNKAIGKRIKTARKNKNLTQKELANMINKTESSIQKYECGNTEVPYSVLQQIATALNVNVSDLLFEQHIFEHTYISPEAFKDITSGGDGKTINKTYYLDEKTAQAAQEILENKQLSLLFDAAKDASPEDLETVHTMLLALKNKDKKTE